MIAWLPWGADAFARAARERKPVLLSITAAWCAACHEMDRTTYADPAVAALVAERFIPVRVDTDRRPDVNERYNLGGWPTTAFLTPDGGVLTGGTFIPVDRMCGVLERVATAASALGRGPAAAEGAAAGPSLDAAGAEGAGEVGPPRVSSAPDVDSNLDIEGLIHSIFSTFDEEHGGFGIEPKFPHAAPLTLAMALYRDTHDPRWRSIAERTLDAMFDGGLWDAERGGFNRYAVTRDWKLPHRERLLSTNAALLAAYADAAMTFGRDADAGRCVAIARFITGTLGAGSGGYRGSDGDQILYMDANAAAARALLHAAAVLGDSALGREALGSLERVLLACYRPGQGLAHYFDGAAHVRGLLADQVAAMSALLDAHDATGGEPYRMMADELAHLVVRDMWDAARGGFVDRAGAPDDIGLLRTKSRPFVENADAALALARVSRLEPRKGFPDPAVFAAHAEGALRAAGEQIAGQGPRAAHYVLAQRQLNEPDSAARTGE
jgi:uncharacterized protein YyaL (SSP411 family)